jgi:putative NIF3 family GTP cyclohydrolase 1 type 2
MISTGRIIERIRQQVGIPWRTETVDTLIAGSLDMSVTGIATTMMATLDVLQRSAADGKNLIITHEPTFYLHQEKSDMRLADEGSRYKKAFIQQHNLSIFHFHDHWHARQPDGIATGMMKALGWEQYVNARNPNAFHFPGTPLIQFVRELQAQLHSRTMRIVGKPDLQVQRVATSWGFLSRDPAIELLARPDIDVLIAGETHEWEAVEYAQDLVTMGQNKALILLGHMLSEQAGMQYCAEWLKTFIPEVPIAFIPLAEPYWNPGNSGM